MWLFLFCALLSPAQTSGLIEGFVDDPSGRSVGGADVTVVEITTNSERKTATDEAGHYAAAGMPPGLYRIEVRRAGFRDEIYSGVELSAGRAVQIGFRLQIGAPHEIVQVEGSTPLLSLSASDWARSIDRRKLDSLPLKGRDLFDLLAQEPGAAVAATSARRVTNGLGTHLSVNGSRPNQNSFRLDGLYINDWSGAAPASAAGRVIGLETIQELRLVSSPFSAEYGRAGGSVITAVSKSGSNQVHGSAYEYFRNSALDAKNFFNSSTAPIPPFRGNQFGGLLSGPLRHDKLFYLGSYEGIRESSSQTTRLVTPNADARRGVLPGRNVQVASQMTPYLALYPLPNGGDLGNGTGDYITDVPNKIQEDYVAGRMDWVVSPAARFSARYTYDGADATSPDPFRLWTFDTVSRNQFIHTETHFVQSPTTIHTLRAGFSRIRNAETGTIRQDVPASLSFIPGQPLGSIEVTGLGDLGGLPARQRPRRFVDNDYQVSYEMALIRGVHTLRAGGGYDRVQFNQISDLNGIGQYRFTSLVNLLQARPSVGDLMQPGSDTVRGWRLHHISGFVQDDFRVNRRLTGTLGIRYEVNSVPTEVNGKIAVLKNPITDSQVTVGGDLYQSPGKANFAPRAALAWDPFGAGRTVIRAGAGLFYDLIGTRELVVSGNRMPPLFNRLTPSNPDFPRLLESALRVTPNVAPDGVDYYLLQPYVLQFQFAVQQQVGRDNVVEAGYSGSRGVHLMGGVGNVNPARPEVQPDGRLFFPATAPRLNPAFDQIGTRRSQFNSFYHAFLARFQHRTRAGLRFDLKYNWSKSIDETSNVIFTDFIAADRVPTMFDYRQNRGLSDFDTRHVFSGSLSWEMPSLGHSAAARVFGGWGFYSLIQSQTGHPFNPHTGFDRSRLRFSTTDGLQRPDATPAFSTPLVLGGPDRYFDAGAFTLQEAGYYGNLGRNTIAGPGLVNVDVSLHKIVWRRERSSVHLRLEVFNLANHPNFQIPSGLDLFNSSLQRLPTAGRITETATPSRQIQLAARWTF